MSTEQEQATSTTGKKNFSPEEKKEAMRLLFEEKLTLQQVADKIGCTVNSVYAWKAKHQQLKKSDSQKQASPTSAKKHYTAKVRKEALHLLRKGELSFQQIADKIGCSITTIKNWKAASTTKKASSKPIPNPAPTQQPPKAISPVAVKKTPIAFDDFVRNYWNQGTRAVDALLMPPDIGPKVVEYVNEALKYAYDQFRK